MSEQRKPLCPLPSRAHMVTDKIIPGGWSHTSGNGVVVDKLSGRPFFLHFSFDAAGYVRDIGYSAKRETEHLPDLLSFACDAVSNLLQEGRTLNEVSDLGVDPFMMVILKRAALAEAAEQARLKEIENG